MPLCTALVALLACTSPLWLLPLPTYAKTSSFLAQTHSPCDCLNWRKSYISMTAVCGEGLELFWATKGGLSIMRAMLHMRVEFCDNFFHRINDTICVNKDLGDGPDPQQWCYVSSSCSSASPVEGGGGVRTKMCEQGRDKRLRDMSPEDLHGYAKAGDFEMGLLVKQAYPREPNIKWDAAKTFFGEDSAVELSDSQRSTLNSITDAGKPVLLDSMSGHPPFAVVHSKKVYLVELDKAHFIPAHMNTLTTWKCVYGCES